MAQSVVTSMMIMISIIGLVNSDDIVVALVLAGWLLMPVCFLLQRRSDELKFRGWKKCQKHNNSREVVVTVEVVGVIVVQ